MSFVAQATIIFAYKTCLKVLLEHTNQKWKNISRVSSGARKDRHMRSFFHFFQFFTLVYPFFRHKSEIF